MSLDAFKTIFWWEWAHRLIARGIGLIFALPLAFFWLTGRLEKRLRWPLAGLLVLGGLQGVIGWWMVSSGLTKLTSVSQYRLAVHLTLAFLIFAGCVWIARGLAPHREAPPVSSRPRRAAAVIVFLVLLQCYLGALVAGLHAGLAYNTWPLMDDGLVPPDLFALEPWWINFFENQGMVQFLHRMTGYLLWAAVLWHVVALGRQARGTAHARRAVLLFALVTFQALLGIATLLTFVHLHTALSHQAGALIVLGFAVAHWRGFIGEYPPEAAAPAKG